MTHLTDPPSDVPPELGRGIEDLTGECAGVHSRPTVERVVVDGYMQLARAARVATSCRCSPPGLPGTGYPPPRPSKDC